ncbi:MAG: hypothetical protein ACOZAL_02565 [Patescibacteria group bacterium]
MGQNSTLISELEAVNCETMTVVYEKWGVRKEYKGSKDGTISLVKKILASPKEMRIIEIQHPPAAE